MTFTMLDPRTDARVGPGAETVKNRSPAKCALGQSAAGLSAGRREWTRAAQRSRDGIAHHSGARTKHSRHCDLPAIDGDQWVLIVQIVAREIANLFGATLSPPAEQCSTMERPELRSVDLRLTARQRDVLALMMQGKGNKDICRTLDLAQATVKNHVTAILKAFKVTSRTQAVIAANGSAWQGASACGAGPGPSHRAFRAPDQV